MLCDKIFRVIPRGPVRVDAIFLAEVLRITHVRHQIEANVTGTSPTMKNISKPALMKLAFALPPKDKQVAMAGTLTNARAVAADLRRQAEEARAKGWTDFEVAIYAPENHVAIAAGRPGYNPSADIPNV